MIKMYKFIKNTKVYLDKSKREVKIREGYHEKRINIWDIKSMAIEKKGFSKRGISKGLLGIDISTGLSENKVEKFKYWVAMNRRETREAYRFIKDLNNLKQYLEEKEQKIQEDVGKLILKQKDVEKDMGKVKVSLDGHSNIIYFNIEQMFTGIDPLIIYKARDTDPNVKRVHEEMVAQGYHQVSRGISLKGDMYEYTFTYEQTTNKELEEIKKGLGME